MNGTDFVRINDGWWRVLRTQAAAEGYITGVPAHLGERLTRQLVRTLIRHDENGTAR